MRDSEAPATTGELLDYMGRNTGRGRYGFVEQHSTAYYSAAWIHGFGGSIIDEDGTPFPDAQAVRDALAALPGTPEVPGDMQFLAFQEANGIELALLGAERAIHAMEKSWIYSGETTAGGF